MTNGKIEAIIATLADELAALRAHVATLADDTCKCSAVVAARHRRDGEQRASRVAAVRAMTDRRERAAAIDALEYRDSVAFWAAPPADVARMFVEAPDHATQDRWLATQPIGTEARRHVRVATHVMPDRVRVTRAGGSVVIDAGVVDVDEHDAEALAALGVAESQIMSREVDVPDANPYAPVTKRREYIYARKGIGLIYKWVGLRALHELNRRLDEEYDTLVTRGDLAVVALTDEESEREQLAEDFHLGAKLRPLVRKEVA